MVANKDQLKQKILYKRLLHSYLEELQGYFDRPINSSELLDIDETKKLSKISFNEDLLLGRKFSSVDELYVILREFINNMKGYVFIKNSINCGAFKVTGIEVLVNLANINKLDEEIIVFISKELKLKILLEYYDDKFELEVYQRNEN